MIRKEDITIRLALAALDPESVEATAMETLLREAIIEIDRLRVMAFVAPTRPTLAELEPDGSA